MQSATKYIIYLRKSSEAEERQALSIPAQEREVRAIAARRGLTVAGPVLQESQSAKRPGRPLFNEMMTALNARKADGILCWHLDRLARNPLDGGAIIWAVGEGIIKEIATPGSNYVGTSDDKLMMTIIFGMSTKYVDDLAKNVRRGNEQALLEGRWPAWPKIGYRRNHESRHLEPDPERFDVVRDLWKMRLRGVPISEIFAYAEAAGLTTGRHRTIGGKPVVLDHLYRIFHDPFYAGVMRYQGKTYPGSHQTMITWSDYQAVQDAFAETKVVPPSRPKTLDFTYRGLIHCGSCGAIVTAENTTNAYKRTYTYYHCCRKNRAYQYCPERSVEESSLDAQLRDAVRSVVIPKKWALKVMNHVERELNDESVVQERLAEQIEKKRSQLETKRRRLEDLLVDGHLTPESHAERLEKLACEERLLQEQAATVKRPTQLIELLGTTISLATDAEKRYSLAEPPQKREILRSLFSNFFLSDRIVRYEAKKILAILGEMERVPDVCALLEHVGTSSRL